MSEKILSIIILFFLGITTFITFFVETIYSIKKDRIPMVVNHTKKIELGQGHVYAIIFVTMATIGFTGLFNFLFKLNLFL